MGLLDGLPNIFTPDVPNTLGTIYADDPEKLKQLQQQSLMKGIIGTAAGYLAQPKNQRYGSAAPYIIKALGAGQQSANDVYTQAATDYANTQKIKQAQLQQQGLSELLNSDQVRNDPVAAALLKADLAKGVDYVMGKSNPDAVKKYEYAKQGGYKGTFMDFLKATAEMNPLAAIAGINSAYTTGIPNNYVQPSTIQNAVQPQTGFKVTDPNGKVHTFSSQDSANKFRDAIKNSLQGKPNNG